MSFLFQLQYKSFKAHVKCHSSYAAGDSTVLLRKETLKNNKKYIHFVEIISTKHIMSADIFVIVLDAKGTKMALSQFSVSLQTSSEERLANEQ